MLKMKQALPLINAIRCKNANIAFALYESGAQDEDNELGQEMRALAKLAQKLYDNFYVSFQDYKEIVFKKTKKSIKHSMGFYRSMNDACELNVIQHEQFKDFAKRVIALCNKIGIKLYRLDYAQNVHNHLDYFIAPVLRFTQKRYDFKLCPKQYKEFNIRQYLESAYYRLGVYSSGSAKYDSAEILDSGDKLKEYFNIADVEFTNQEL